jgi:hypothetical protein
MMKRQVCVLVSVFCSLACLSCTPRSGQPAPAARVRFQNLGVRDGQLSADVVFLKAPNEHMLRMLMLEGIYQRDGIWSSEFVFLETGHWRALPGGASGATSKVTRVRQNLSGLLDSDGLAAVRLRALVWAGPQPPYLAEPNDLVYSAWQSPRLPVTESRELLRGLGLQ